MQKRLFLAVGLPDEERKALSYEMDAIEGELSERLNPRASGPNRLHFTIIFLDSQDEELVPDIVKAMEKAALDTNPFEVKIGKTDYDPGTSEKRMVWAYGESSEMAVLRDRLAKALQEEGVAFPRFRGEFVPHITLVRFNPERGDKLPQMISELDIKYTARSVELLESEWPDGDEYNVIHSIDLGSKTG